jgi:hypothetical protein
MSKFLRKATAQITAIEAYSISNTFSAVGVGLHWRNSSSLKWSTQMDSDSNRLFHQVDRICPHQKRITQSNYQLPGGYHSLISDSIAQYVSDYFCHLAQKHPGL